MILTTRVESRGAWSPDGRAIAFNSDRLGEMNIWLHDVATGADRRLTSGPGGDYQPEWSPDGRSLVFFSARAGNIDVWSVTVGDGRLVRLTDAPAMETNPFYSPDGRSIAFMSDRLGRTEVWMMNADGSGQRRVGSTGAGGHFIRWTRDGRSVVYRAESGTQTRIVRVDVEQGTVTPMPEIASGGAHVLVTRPVDHPRRARTPDALGLSGGRLSAAPGVRVHESGRENRLPGLVPGWAARAVRSRRAARGGRLAAGWDRLSASAGRWRTTLMDGAP